MPNFTISLQKLSSALDRIISHNTPISSKNDILDFHEKKRSYQMTLFKTAYKEFLSSSLDLNSILNSVPTETIRNIKSKINLVETSYQKDDFATMQKTLKELQVIDLKTDYPKEKESLQFKIPNIPKDISDDMNADLKELEKCFTSGCFRSSVILCGRLLEISLHRKYFDATSQDILEKNPGIGLGTLIAKLKEKNISLDPAITQQVHLINQVRIYSVHIKKEAFYPTKDQTHAIILYTIDIIKKLF